MKKTKKQKAEKKKDTLLIVDDEKIYHVYLQHILGKDYHLLVCSSGEEAIERIPQLEKEQIPGVILLDIMMKQKSGYQVCLQIRKHQWLPFSKILLLSSKKRLPERLKGYKMGADDFITKPFNADELVAKVRVFMELYKTQTRLQELNVWLEREVQNRVQELMQSKKMAFIGMHSAQIVHNLNSPLTIIQNCAYMIEEKKIEKPYTQMIQRACVKFNEIIKTLLTLINHNHHFEPTLVDMNHIIRTEVELMKYNPLCYQYVNFRLYLNKVPLVKGSPFHFSQVIGNLLKNAVDALQGKKEKAEITVRCDRGKKYISIQIQDNGIGMSQFNLEKIFNPLFSTKKKDQKGSGLGLSYCKDIVQQCHGKLWAKSCLHRGSVFYLQIPIQGNPSQEIKTKGETSKSSAGTARIARNKTKVAG